MRILIADDDPFIRRCLAVQVATDGFEPVVCGNGAEALQILSSSSAPPIGLIDWIMPGLSGLDVCSKLRSLALPLQPYLIIITVKHDSSDIAAALETGANDYIIKPFSLLELGTRIRVGKHNVELQTSLLERIGQYKTVTDLARRLHGLLPLCDSCRKPRTDPAYWEEVKNYFTSHEDPSFTCGLCAECAARLTVGKTFQEKITASPP